MKELCAVFLCAVSLAGCGQPTIKSCRRIGIEFVDNERLPLFLCKEIR